MTPDATRFLMSICHAMDRSLFAGDAIYYTLRGYDSGRELSLSADIDSPVFGEGFRTTVSIANVRGRPGYICDVKCEAAWPELVSAAQSLAEWLEARALNYDISCSGSHRSWMRFRVYGVSQGLALQLMGQWGGVQLGADERLVGDLRDFEARLQEASREVSKVAEEFQTWRSQRWSSEAEGQIAAVGG